MIFDVPADSYKKDCITNTQYYDHAFINSHCQMLFHIFHPPDMIFVPLLSTKEPITKRTGGYEMDKQIKIVYSILHHVDHYAVLELFVEKRLIVIWDGF